MSALRFEEFNGSFATFPEVEVAPDENLLRVQAIDEHISNEVFRARRRPCCVEFDHVDDIDTERFEELELAGQPGQDLRSRVGSDHDGWMNVERHDNRLDAMLGGPSLHLVDNRLMTKMDAIEGTRGEHARIDSLIVAVADDFHYLSSDRSAVVLVVERGGSARTTAGFTVDPRCSS